MARVQEVKQSQCWKGKAAALREEREKSLDAGPRISRHAGRPVRADVPKKRPCGPWTSLSRHPPCLPSHTLLAAVYKAVAAVAVARDPRRWAEMGKNGGGLGSRTGVRGGRRITPCQQMPCPRLRPVPRALGACCEKSTTQQALDGEGKADGADSLAGTPENRPSRNLQMCRCATSSELFMWPARA